MPISRHCLVRYAPGNWGLVICELRTGELVGLICELIVRTTDANLGTMRTRKGELFMQLKEAHIRACV